MAKMLLRLGPEDAAKYPDGDKWFAWDKDALLDLPASELVSYEDAMGGYTVGQLLVGIRQNSTLAMRAVYFIARRQAGVLEKWENFDPKVWKAEFKLADPGSDEQAEDDPPPFPPAPASG